MLHVFFVKIMIATLKISNKSKLYQLHHDCNFKGYVKHQLVGICCCVKSLSTLINFPFNLFPQKEKTNPLIV
jgi:hypothetical protein